MGGSLTKTNPAGLAWLSTVGSDDREVGRCEIEGGQLRGINPTQCDVFVGVRSGAVRSQAADKRKHLDQDGRIVVDKRGQRADDFDHAAEFLVEFAEERIGG